MKIAKVLSILSGTATPVMKTEKDSPFMDNLQSQTTYGSTNWEMILKFKLSTGHDEGYGNWHDARLPILEVLKNETIYNPTNED